MVRVIDIISRFNYLINSVSGNVNDACIDRISSLENATSNSMIWVSPQIMNKQIIAEQTLAKLIIADDINYSHQLRAESKIIIHTNRPRLLAIKIAIYFFKSKELSFISPTSIIDKHAKIGNNCYIGENCIIKKCSIGDNTVIRDNAVICNDVTIGNNCTINIGAVIGAETAGQERDLDGSIVTFPHFAGVIIGNGVTIGIKSQVNRGVLNHTIIEDGVYIDSMVYIGHNSVIKSNVFIATSVCVLGSVFIGSNANIYANALIKQKLKIGSNACIGMGSVVTRNIPDNEIWYGVPAIYKTTI